MRSLIISTRPLRCVTCAGVVQVASIMAKARERNVKVHFAIDHVIADEFKADAKVMCELQLVYHTYRLRCSSLRVMCLC